MISVETTRILKLGGIRPFALLRMGHPAFVVPRTKSRGTLLLRCGVCGRLLVDGRGGRAFEHRASADVLADEDEQGDRGHGEDDGGPGGHAGEQIGGAARTECSLRSLTAEGAGEIGALALLQQDNRDHEDRDDDVNDGQEDDHGTAFWWRCAPEIRVERTIRNSPRDFRPGLCRLRIQSGAEGGT
jgi:hypothetical protein